MSDSRIAQLLRFLRMKRREGYKLLRSSEIRRFGDSGRSLLPSELACHCRIVGRRARFGLIGRWGYAGCSCPRCGPEERKAGGDSGLVVVGLTRLSRMRNPAPKRAGFFHGICVMLAGKRDSGGACGTGSSSPKSVTRRIP